MFSAKQNCFEKFVKPKLSGEKKSGELSSTAKQILFVKRSSIKVAAELHTTSTHWRWLGNL